jgi:putative phage-type endonuclease
VTSTKQQLSNYGIGASEISTVVGMNPFASPWDLWTLKVGDRDAVIQNQAMEWGHRLEPAIRQKYADETQAHVQVPLESMFSKETPWARATPDGIVVDESGDHSKWLHLLQCKNVSFWMGKEWADTLPVYVQLQELWEMYVTGLSRADVACLIGGNDFRIYTVHRDDKAISDLVTLAADFWRRVESKTPPEIDNSAACKEHFEKRLALENAVELTADSELESLFANWRANTLMAKSCSKEIDRIRNVVRSHMADAQADRVVSTIGIAKLNKNRELMAPKNWSKENA